MIACGFDVSDGTRVELVTSGPLSAETLGEALEFLRVFKTVLEKRDKAKLADEPEETT